LYIGKGKVHFNAEYQQFELPEPIDLEAGERFSIVLFGVRVMFEGTANGMVSNPGESFAYQNSCVGWEYAIDNVVSNQGLSKWVDTATGLSEYRASTSLKDQADHYKWHNIAIYAFTDDVEEQVSPNDSKSELPAEVIDVTRNSDGSTKITYYSDKNLSACLYTAVYNTDGRLAEARKESLTIQNNTETIISPCADNQYTKVLLWSDTENKKPLADSIELR